MKPSLTRIAPLLLAAALSAASCASGTPVAGSDPSATAGTVSPAPSATRPAAIFPGSAAPSGSAGIGSTPKTSSSVGPSPSPFPTPWTPEIPVQASIQPACVLPGGTATITIVTQPKAGVAYHAVYAGTKGGAPPPYGSGYGGDAGGMTDGEGRYTSSWVVSPAAPVGPARADVIVGWDEKWGYAGPGFAVAGPSGTC